MNTQKQPLIFNAEVQAAADKFMRAVQIISCAFEMTLEGLAEIKSTGHRVASSDGYLKTLRTASFSGGQLDKMIQAVRRAGASEDERPNLGEAWGDDLLAAIRYIEMEFREYPGTLVSSISDLIKSHIDVKTVDTSPGFLKRLAGRVSSEFVYQRAISQRNINARNFKKAQTEK